ncbi:Rab5-interacting protein-domain-containing protein [Dipodascopsis tothii]|uniref:Rab5-interacting protein-domain-containing protein n=1 Tax=Dipodascopsis tothii TaxID=44089 RepID=UPI0034CDDA96
MDANERAQLISPLSAESLMYNVKAVYYVRSVSSLVFGAAAGILRLESYYGFLFYAFWTAFVSLLVYTVLARGQAKRYFGNSKDIWVKDTVTGLSSFVLAWTLFYGLVDA